MNIKHRVNISAIASICNLAVLRPSARNGGRRGDWLEDEAVKVPVTFSPVCFNAIFGSPEPASSCTDMAHLPVTSAAKLINAANYRSFLNSSIVRPAALITLAIVKALKGSCRGMISTA